MPDKQPTKMPGGLELTFGLDQYSGLVGAGLLGILPATSWLLGMILPIEAWFDASHGRAGGDAGTFMMGLGAVAALAVLAGPAVIACRVLRARQPDGARITWDDEAVVEWDGAWRRTVVPWQGLEAASTLRPGEELRTRVRREAIQLRGQATDGCITVWDIAPEEAPVVRRRLCSSRVRDLRHALSEHGVAFTGTFDSSLTRDPDRQRPRANRVVGRFGYVAAVLAPLIAGPSRSMGLVVAVVGAGLLAYRALPVLAELRVIKARIDAYDRNDANEVARRGALVAKRRAARLEASARIACVVLTLVSTLGSAVGPWGGDGPRT